MVPLLFKGHLSKSVLLFLGVSILGIEVNDEATTAKVIPVRADSVDFRTRLLAFLMPTGPREVSQRCASSSKHKS